MGELIHEDDLVWYVSCSKCPAVLGVCKSVGKVADYTSDDWTVTWTTYASPEEAIADGNGAKYCVNCGPVMEG